MSNHTEHLVIRASAGAGKTFQLTNHYLRQLLAGTAADEILAATFTRKAAGEILERVLSRLAKAATSPAEAAKLAGELNDPGRTSDEFRTCLMALVRDLHRLQVGTLDSFFAKLATNFTLELGLPPGWRIVEVLDDRHLRTLAIATILREQRTSEVARLTNLLAKGDAARSVSGLIRRTVDNFYEIYRETEAAAWQQFPEAHRLTDLELESAIAALEAVELPKHGSIAKARVKDVESLRSENWGEFIDGGIGGKVLSGETKYYGKQLSDEVVVVYRRLLDHVRGVTIQELAHQTLATRQLLERFDGEYQKLKRDHRSLRFDDVTHRLRERLASQGAQGLAYRLDGHVEHLLLDEFQDTSPAQWDVLRPFAERITSPESNGSFFCVGDTKQAIYGWRGGVAEIFDALDGQLLGLQSVPLAESYRSSQPVIDTVNRLFAGIGNHPDLGDDGETIRDWCDAFPVHTTAKKELPGYACVVAADVTTSEDGKATDDILPSTAMRVAAIVRETPRASVGVLLRRNEDIATVMNLLRGMNVPASEEGGNPITDSAAVLTILSLVTMADHPGDTACRFHVARSPLGESLSFIDHADDAAAAQLAEQVRAALVNAGYGPSVEHWAAVLMAAGTFRDRMRLAQLVELGYRFDADATLRPTDFVRFVEEERFRDPSADRVRVMTVHAAKGLEFDVVVAPLTESKFRGQTPPFVAGRQGPTGPIGRVCLYRKEAIQRLLPDDLQQAFAAARSREIREVLCRLYVTVTRAIHALHVIVPGSSGKLPKCPAGLVRAALTDGDIIGPNQIAYEEGDRDWYTKLPEKESEFSRTETSERAEERAAIDPIRLANMAAGRSRGLGRVAPSRHDSDAPVPMRRVLETQNASALQRGTLIHAWFEQVTWLDAATPKSDELRQIAAKQGFASDEVEAMLGQFSAMLRQDGVSQLLTRESYRSREKLPFSERVADTLAVDDVGLDVRQELPIAAPRGGEITIGSIDRLVLFRRGETVLAADIIDFKTDAVDPGDEPAWSDRVATYQSQLSAYADAVSRIYGLPLDCIAARLVFVEPQVVVSIDVRAS